LVVRVSDEYYRGRQSFSAVRDKLTQSISGKGVTIHYADRQRLAGVGSIHGIRTAEFLDIYRKALEWALKRLTAPPISLPPPLFPVNVYCSEIADWRGESNPVTFDERSRDVLYPAIALPSRTSSISPDQERQFLISAAVHELTHVLCVLAQKTSVHKVAAGAWCWLAEATSVWVETLLASKKEAASAGVGHTLDWLFNTLDWCDYPEAPIDADATVYQSAQFMRYLVALYGERLVGDMWKTRGAHSDPWPVIKTLTGRTADDLFGEYAGQSYVLNDRRSKCYFPEIFRRFGGRLVTENWLLRPGDVAVAEGNVWQLGCCYYRMNPADAQSFEIEWNGVGAASLVVGAATNELRRVGGIATMKGAGTKRVRLRNDQQHVWVAVCGRAGSGETRFSFVVKAG
jgi:hypothetical protein